MFWSATFDCSDLHFRWNSLAAEYEALWANIYPADVAARLSNLIEKSAELSSSGTAFLYSKRIMAKWKDQVPRQRVPSQRKVATA